MKARSRCFMPVKEHCQNIQKTRPAAVVSPPLLLCRTSSRRFARPLAGGAHWNWLIRGVGGLPFGNQPFAAITPFMNPGSNSMSNHWVPGSLWGSNLLVANSPMSRKPISSPAVCHAHSMTGIARSRDAFDDGYLIVNHGAIMRVFAGIC